MSKKRHHMTKHQYNAYQKQHRRQNKHRDNMEIEGGPLSAKFGKRNDKNMLKLLRGSQRALEDFLDEEYDEISSP